MFKDIKNFIKSSYKPYEGDSSFLKGPTKRTIRLLKKINILLKKETKKGVLSIDTKVSSSILSHKPGYINKKNERIVGLQTDKPLKRAVKIFGGLQSSEIAASFYGYRLDKKMTEFFKKYRKTHNEGVMSVYNDDIKKLVWKGVITGLPDSYARGRLIGDYRKVAFYGVDKLVQSKKEDFNKIPFESSEENIRLREEVFEQITALEELKKMAEGYGFDISQPASNAKEAIQWTYLAYLAAIKEQDGAAMSLGRVDSFFDVYIEKDIQEGKLTEEHAQELIDDLVIKLRLVRHLRTPQYNELFAGDPTWVTCSLGGTTADGKPMITKTSYRFLQTLFNLGPSPEPNLTVLWSKGLFENFKRFAVYTSIKTSCLQYENDDIMKPYFNDDYAISCCVSAMDTGKDTQFFGARCNIAKLLLIAINGGKDEMSGELLGPQEPVMDDKVLDYNKVIIRFDKYLDWLCKNYADMMNVIHYMHDKYNYERLQMALHDTFVRRFMAFGIAGFSVLIDSLSAIKYAQVKPVKNNDGLIIDYETKGEFPKFGNDDAKVDLIAIEVVEKIEKVFKKYRCYRGATPTMSLLTITSNVVYGKKTGNTPDGRRNGEPFAPGANPMNGRDKRGALASLNSVAKIPYSRCLDGISNTFSIIPNTLGPDETKRTENLVSLLDVYFNKGGHHINVNVIDKDRLQKAMEHPEKYPNLTVRVSGYAVNFSKLSKEQQLDVISRTFHLKV